MFDQTFVGLQSEAKKPWTVAASLAFQCGVVGILLLIPLLHPELLQLKIEVPIFIPLRPLTEVKPAVAVAAAHRQGPARTFTAPTKIPDRIAVVVEDAPPAEVAVNFGPVGPAAGFGTAGLTGLNSAPLPNYVPPPPAATIRKPEVPKAPLHVSSGIQAAKLLFGPKPAYPSLARAARVQGTVRIQATIARDGSIQNLNIRSGPPLLVNAAIDAVRQWRYQPTLLSGEPVEVITEIEVNFTINQ